MESKAPMFELILPGMLKTCPDSGAGVTFLCEPDNPQIVTMLNDLRFFKENRNRASGDLFVLKYPLDEDLYGAEDLEGISRVFDNIRFFRSILATV